MKIPAFIWHLRAVKLITDLWLLTLMLFVLRPFGISNMIISYAALNLVWLFVWHYFVSREIGFTLPMFLRDIIPYFLLSAAVMYATAMLTAGVTDIYILLPLRIVVAAAIYLLALLLFRSAELRELAEYLISRKKRIGE